MKDYTLFAIALTLCGTAFGVVALVLGATPVEGIAIVTPFLGLAGTVMGRDKDEDKSNNDSATGS